jgi:hypothetical protein
MVPPVTPATSRDLKMNSPRGHRLGGGIGRLADTPSLEIPPLRVNHPLLFQGVRSRNGRRWQWKSGVIRPECIATSYNARMDGNAVLVTNVPAEPKQLAQ